MKFCVNIVNSTNYLLKSIYELKSRDELISIQGKYGIDKNSKVSWRTAIWRYFELSINLQWELTDVQMYLVLCNICDFIYVLWASMHPKSSHQDRVCNKLNCHNFMK